MRGTEKKNEEEGCKGTMKAGYVIRLSDARGGDFLMGSEAQP